MPSSPIPLFVACWGTGSDPRRDGVFRLEARTFAQDPGPESPLPGTWFCPLATATPGGVLARRMKRLGLDKDIALSSLPLAQEHLAEALRPLAGQLLVVASGREALLARFRHFLPNEPAPTVLDLTGLAALLHPIRGDRSWRGVWQRFFPGEVPEELSALQVRHLAAVLVETHFQRGPALRQLVARSFDHLRRACDEEPSTGDWLDLAQTLLDRPSFWGSIPTSEESLFRKVPADGPFADDLEDAPLDADLCFRELVPEFQLQYEATFAEHEPLPNRLDGEDAPLEPEDLQTLEGFFDHLPRLFDAEGATAVERPGQRALAHAVRTALERHKFLLADAPTGTGKTLAYLAPLLIWAVRHGTRTALSTYTRALQEQAFFREVPRALKLLREAGFPEDRMPRVSLLKGRANYICGRAIREATQQPGTASPAAIATWLRLALWYAEDPTADLDGFSPDPGLPTENRARLLRTARAGVSEVRSLPGCCFGRARKRCPAGVRNMRADRSHVVVVNHAYLLARPDEFHHGVLDECDHLHPVTVSARSYDIEFDEVTQLCETLTRNRRRRTAPLGQLAHLISKLAPGDATDTLHFASEQAQQAVIGVEASATECTRELRRYRVWREENEKGLSPEERAFLLHDFLEADRGNALALGLNHLKDQIDVLDSSLRTAIEELGALELRDAPRLAYALRRPLESLSHWREGLFLWLGGKNDDPAEGDGDFSDDFLYDAVFDRRRRPLLALKWLLPQRWLGLQWFPSLRGMALVSATTKLRGGFRAMKGYLGLDLLLEGSEEHSGREVLEFSGPPTFDPQNALVCIPQDAPDYGPSGQRLSDWLDYLQDAFLYLSERTGGGVLGLFTNRKVLQQVGERLSAPFAAAGIPFYWQGMPGLSKEEIAERFRSEVDSVLLGLDTFWYGVDFPGETCQYVVLTKLPFGVLNDYHWAQVARLGRGPQRSRVYLPKALSMFRQGCGRLLRNEHDRGGILILDHRVLEKRHADFLAELPRGPEDWEEPHLLADTSDSCFHKLFSHMRLGADLKRRELSQDFSQFRTQLHAEA